MSINKTGALHFELLGQRVHLGDEHIHRRDFRFARRRHARRECRSNVIRQRVGGDIVRLDERGIEKVAQRDHIPRLKSDVVLECPDKRLWRNDHGLIEIAPFMLGPIQHDHGSRDLG